MKRIILWMLMIAVCVSLVAVFTLAGCKEEAAPVEEAVEEEAAPAKEAIEEEPVNLVIWWWGEQEAAGLEGYMQESVEKYSEMHPNVTFELVLQSTESLVEAFRAAGAAGEGPDIQYFWGGILTIEDAWNGYIVPISDYLSEEELSHVYTRNEQFMGDKVWGLPWYMVPMVFGYNKQIFLEAGLDPDEPPKTWTDLMDACEAIKAIGKNPFVLGNQEGIQGGWMQGYLGGQWFSGKTPKDFMEPVIGNASYADPKYSTWWKYYGMLRDNEYLNDDYQSIQLYQGMEEFMAGNGAITFAALSSSVEWMNVMGVDNVGLMAAPVIEEATGEWAKTDMLDFSSQTLAITSWSKNKEVAADFLKFLHTPERQNEMYLQSGAPPCDDRFDLNLLKTEQEKWVYDQLLNDNWFFHNENYVPWQINLDGNYVVGQQFIDENLTPDEAAQRAQDVAELFRRESPDTLQYMTEWYNSFSEIFKE